MKSLHRILCVASMACTAATGWALSITFDGSGTIESCLGTIGFQFSAADLADAGQGFGLTLSDGARISGSIDIGRIAGPGLINVVLVYPGPMSPFSLQEGSIGRFQTGSPLEAGSESPFYDRSLILGTDVFCGGFAVEVNWDGAVGFGSGDWHFERSSTSGPDPLPVPDGGTTICSLGLAVMGLEFVRRRLARP
ncbi:MAG TPA: hypothetical protein VLT83_08620 [Opitutaceae bacterium]|nr:hypothetical protein [Opitutaceae bacterium]